MVKISSFRQTPQESGVSVGFHEVAERDGGMVVIGTQPGSCFARRIRVRFADDCKNIHHADSRSPSALSRIMRGTRVIPVSLRTVLTRFRRSFYVCSSRFFEPNG